MPRILNTINKLNDGEIRDLYAGFNAPIATLDCGKKCAQHNPSGKPFCCDICHAVPAAYRSEWAYVQDNTNLWHRWRGDECEKEGDVQKQRKLLMADTPQNMILLACLGPDRCQRDFRLLSCRQFPFFPYVTSDYRFLGLAYEWGFEPVCWVISNLELVSSQFRQEFISTYDQLFPLFQDEFDAYAIHSEHMREHFLKERRRFPVLHRNGAAYLVSPRSERITRIEPGLLPRYGLYRQPAPASK